MAIISWYTRSTMKHLIVGAMVLLLAMQAAFAASVVIPVDPDGHFRVQGMINGVPATFLIDTGATHVSVSADFARRANLAGGTPRHFETAGGIRTGRIIAGVGVSAGPLFVPDATIAVGMVGLGNDEVLLGQSFLRRFVVIMDGRQMVLRERASQAENSPSDKRLQGSSGTAPPVPEFSSDEAHLAYLRWLVEISERLTPRIPDWPTRKEFLQTVWYEAPRAGMDVSLLLGLIEDLI